MANSNNNMQDIFRRSGFDLTPRQLEQFNAYYRLLAEHNEALDLTRLTTFKDIVIKHFIDSIYFTEFVEVPSPIVDIGTGGGFPGIPLKIFLPDLRLILAEPRKKRASFLEMAVKELRLTGVEVYPHMVTNLSDFSVQGAVTRALEPIDETLTRVCHFLPLGGAVIFLKGPDADADLAAVSDANRTAYSLVSDTHYTLPATDYDRRVIAYRKETDAARKTYAILKDLTATAGTAITSSENRKFKELVKLSTGGGMRKSGSMLVSGKKVITEMLEKAETAGSELVLPDGYAEDDDGMNAAMKDFAGRGALLVLKKALFNQIDLFNTGGPLLVAAAPEMPEWDGAIGPGCTLVIPFQDPVNVGSSIRSAAGFNVRDIIVLKEAAHPYHPKAARTSAGAVFGVNLKRGPSLDEFAKLAESEGWPVVALDRDGAPLSSFAFPGRFILVPGIEGPGLPQELRKMAVSIPISGDVESLNAPVALSIALYEWRRQSPSN